MSGNVERKNGKITLSNSEGEVLDSYTIQQVWPCSWKVITDPDCGSTFIEIGLAVEGIERKDE